MTYPVVTAMLGAPKVKAVIGFSDFGYSFVYVIFEDGTDIYWARSRTQEYLSAVLPRLPQGVRTEMGPDATALGWIYQYVLVDESGKHSLADLRSYQDWYLRYYLKSVPGVAEVAPLGGFVRQYQVNVDPNRLQAYGISISRVVEAVRTGDVEVGGRLIEFGGTEYMVRGRGYARSIEDFENIVLMASETGTPIRIKVVGEVTHGPDYRRGVADLDGEGGLSNAWTMPIKARIDMLTTGIRTPVGIKISGADLRVIEDIGSKIEAQLLSVKGTRSVFAERTGGGYFIDVVWNREEIARYGLSIGEAQAAVQNAIGGENVTTSVEGRERYPVNVRYLADFRTDFGSLGRVLVPASEGKRQIPIGQLVTISAVGGASMIRDEDGLLTGYVYVDVADRDPGSYVAETSEMLRDVLQLPVGYALT